MVSRTSLLALLIGLALPPTAHAQSKFTFKPSFEALGIYDDNLFSTSSGPVATHYFRFTPAFDTGYDGTFLTLRANYMVDGELYPDLYSDLTNPLARQRALVGLSYLFTRRTSLNLDASYIQSERPGDLVEPTGLDLGRRSSERYQAGLAVTRQVSAHNALDVGYDFRLMEVQTANSSISHSLTAGWSHQYSPSSSSALKYTFRMYSFGDDFGEVVVDERTSRSHSLTFGWTHQVTSVTSITLQLGPRLSEDFAALDVSSADSADVILRNELSADAYAAINYQKKQTRVSLAYTRGQNQVFAQSGFVNTDSLIFIYGQGAGRSFNFSISPGVYRNTRGGVETWTYRARVTANLGLADWLALTATYRYNFQDGRFVSAPAGVVSAGREFDHNVVMVGLTFERSSPSQ